ncbi:MAG: DUF1292 domain-containing protein [Christensenellaceae bacterium]|jgi:hypothetical protein|nr:DUF1292 domain-containing protein [Christensenellaceae bacterium]
MEDERDIVVFTDEEGNDLELEVLDYIFYNGEEYAVLAAVEEEEHEHHHHDHDHAAHEHDHAHEHGHHHHDHAHDEEEQELYLMKVVQLEDDMEEFVPIEDDALMDALIEIVQNNFAAEYEEGEEDEEDEKGGEDEENGIEE